MKLKLLLLTIVASLSTSGYTQVTIGDSSEPVAGAILQLKENNSGTNNSNKGLLLPRVALTDLTTLNDIAPAANPRPESAAHEGLMIFNIKENLSTDPVIYLNAPYIWTNNKWQSLMRVNESDRSQPFDPAIGILTDYEGNGYSTRVMPDGRRWMTQNLRSIRKKDGNLIDPINGLYLNPARGSLTTSSEPIHITLEIPRLFHNTVTYINAGAHIQDQRFNEYAIEFGLMYTWHQAMVACPTGWHIPTWAEWDALAFSIGGVRNSPSDPRHFVNIGHKMKKNNGTLYVSSDGAAGKTWGSSGTIEVGFNIVPAGVGHGGKVGRYCNDTLFWSDTSAFNSTPGWTAAPGWYRGILYNDEVLYCDNFSPDLLISVRCIQD